MKRKLALLFSLIKSRTKLNWLWAAILILAISCLVSIISFWIASVNCTNKILSTGYKLPVDSKMENGNTPSNYIRRKIDGVYVESKEADYYPIAIMIDNHPDSRPSAGLAHANLVYEAIAEGIVTRFLAVYAGGQPVEKIGPVRSARPYFIDWSEGLDAMHVHVGGSPAALQKIDEEKIFNLNEYFQENYFWRDERFFSPHNVFTSSDNLNKYLDKLQVSDADYESWSYKSGDKTGDIGQNISIDFSTPQFKVKWVYDKENNDYLREQGGVIHKDADSSEIRAKNVVMIYVNSIVLDELLRRELTTLGTGKAIYCFDGECEQGRWKKELVNKRKKIYDKWNEEVRFNAGTTWIEVIQDEIEVNLTFL